MYSYPLTSVSTPACNLCLLSLFGANYLYTRYSAVHTHTITGTHTRIHSQITGRARAQQLSHNVSHTQSLSMPHTQSLSYITATDCVCENTALSHTHTHTQFYNISL